MKKRTDPTQIWTDGLVATEMEAQVMAAYLADRSPVMTPECPAKEYLDTGDVQSELWPIIKIEDAAIVDYLLWCGYTMRNNFTGTPRWVIWRRNFD